MMKNRHVKQDFVQPEIDPRKIPFTKPPTNPAYATLLTETQQDIGNKQKRISNDKPNEQVKPEDIRSISSESSKMEDSKNIIRPQLSRTSIENKSQIPIVDQPSQPRIPMPSIAQFHASFLSFLHWYKSEIQRNTQNNKDSPKQSDEEIKNEEPASMLLNLVPAKKQKNTKDDAKGDAKKKRKI
mmetsp:Transcript_23613/g.23362  ORF Transcript_23613/g.23362 Transcript_23613/m.23362 type:complete len:184 (+) Transcript_23613:729-1280(+)